MHQLWHIGVLALTILGGGSALLLVLVPLAFDDPPQGFTRSRRWLIGLVLIAVGLVTAEWTVVH